MKLVHRLIAVIALMTGSLSATVADATTVTPVIVDLQTTGRGVASAISVTNNSAGPMTMEIAIISLKATAKGFEPIANANADADDDLLVSPPSALIAAGKTQTFRVQWIGDPDLAHSKHYYVSINQLPVKLGEGQSAVQVVYNFQVLVSVSASGQKANLAIASATPSSIDGKPVAAITVQNNGGAHGYISQHKIRITETSASGAELMSRTISGSEFQSLVGYGLVASGQTRSVNVPLDKPAPAGATLSAVLVDERAQ